MKTLSADTPDMKIEDSKDVVKLISATINQVRKGEIDPRVANAIGYLANILIKAVEQGDLEGRIADLEAVMKARSNAPGLPDMTMTGTD